MRPSNGRWVSSKFAVQINKLTPNFMRTPHGPLTDWICEPPHPFRKERGKDGGRELCGTVTRELFGFRSRRAGEDALQRRAALLFLVGLGQRLAGHHLVALSRVVDEDRFHRRYLLQVGGLQSLDHVLIGVVRPRLVVEHVLVERKPRNADRVEAQVIGGACVGHRNGSYAQVLQWRYPLRED